MIIYKVTNIINNKIYIGQTIHSLNIRKSQHERSHEYGYKTAFSNAIKKYGKENFIWEIINETDSIHHINTIESFYIDKYNYLLTQNAYK